MLIAGVVSLLYRLKLEKDLAIGTVRTVVQLLLAGWALGFVFTVSDPWLSVGVLIFMTGWAAQAARARIKRAKVPVIEAVALPLLVSTLLCTTLVTGLVVRSDPWWDPRYFLTLGGMIAGNAMTAVALALERLYSILARDRAQVELLLSFGLSPSQATERQLREAVQSGMTPSINAMMTVGLVTLPGMMTGQVIAGADPVQAVKYQIVVMLMLTGATAIATVLAALAVRRRCFNALEQLQV